MLKKLSISMLSAVACLMSANVFAAENNFLNADW